MSDEGIRPLPDDSTADQILKMFDLDAEDWEYSEAGDYQAAAVEAWNRDGSNFETLIALEWPARNRKSNETHTLRLLMHPKDAIGLAELLVHSVRWLKSRRIVGN